MTILIDLQEQISKLQKQADDLRAKEFGSTLAEIKAKMAAFGITIKDLTAAAGKKSKGVKAARSVKSPKDNASAKPMKKPRVAVAAKYRGPNGEVWTGRGLTPKWMKSLIEAGQTKESFEIKS